MTRKKYYEQAIEWLGKQEQAQPADAEMIGMMIKVVKDWGQIAVDRLQERMSFADFCRLTADQKFFAVCSVTMRCNPKPILKNAYGQ